MMDYSKKDMKYMKMDHTDFNKVVDQRGYATGQQTKDAFGVLPKKKI